MDTVQTAIHVGISQFHKIMGSMKMQEFIGIVEKCWEGHNLITKFDSVKSLANDFQIIFEIFEMF